MSLDLNSSLSWAWLLSTASCVHICDRAVGRSGEADAPGNADGNIGCDVLASHNLVKSVKADPAHVTSIDLPFAGALSHRIWWRIGRCSSARQGGFYTACAEDIYPCCWSALFAVAAAKIALKDRFVQDALQNYRHKWGATLGDYLRGPQQNLKFLLPLVYRNATMAARLAEAILAGASVVR